MPKKRDFWRWLATFLNFFWKTLDFFLSAWYYIKAVAMSGALKKDFLKNLKKFLTNPSHCDIIKFRRTDAAPDFEN